MSAPLSTHMPGHAGGLDEKITGTKDVNTGLMKVESYGAVLAENAALAGDTVTCALIAAKDGIPAKLTIKVWKRTSAADCTPVAATDEKKVTWWALGA